MIENVSNFNAIVKGASTARASKAEVVDAIKSASERTGVDFSYLLTKAMQESSLNTQAKAAGSSATGLYQFIDQTWLKTIKENGEEYGLGSVADKITIGSDGVARVANAADRKAILELRKDPEISANMAAELAKDNKERLQETIGGQVGSTEMYLAHFLGSGGAGKLLTAMHDNPNISAASILPSAASANRSVFYDKTTGQAKTVAEVYNKYAAKFDGLSLEAQEVVQVASADVSTKSANEAQARYAELQVADGLLQESMSDQVIASQSGLSVSSDAGSVGDVGGSGSGMSISAYTPSPFATMMLAQMDMQSFGQEAAADAYAKTDKEREDTVLDTLALS